MIKDKQSIILLLEKGEKETDLSTEYGVSKQQISDICKKEDKIMKFVDNLESNEGLKLHTMSGLTKCCTVGLFSKMMEFATCTLCSKLTLRFTCWK